MAIWFEVARFGLCPLFGNTEDDDSVCSSLNIFWHSYWWEWLILLVAAIGAVVAHLKTVLEWLYLRKKARAKR
jgi:hypothetical protein